MHHIRPTIDGKTLTPAAISSPSRQVALSAQFDARACQDGDLESMLHEACRTAAEGVGTRFVGLLQHRADEQAFVLQAGIGWQARMVGRVRIAADLQTTAGLAWHFGQAIHFRHLVAGGRIRIPDALARCGVHRVISVPVRGATAEAFGVLEVASAAAGEFVQHDLLFLQALADSVAAAVDRHAGLASQADQTALAAERRVFVRKAAPDAAKGHPGPTLSGLQQDTPAPAGIG